MQSVWLAPRFSIRRRGDPPVLCHICIGEVVGRWVASSELPDAWPSAGIHTTLRCNPFPKPWSREVCGSVAHFH